MASWVSVEVTPDPRPSKRFKASKAEWERIRERFAYATCVSCGLAANHLHHVAFKKADRGDDVVENLAPMCLSCHGRFHDHGVGWERIAAAIRAYVWSRQSRLNYVDGKMTRELFDRRYPALGDAATGFNHGASAFNNPERLTVSERRERECDPEMDAA